MFPLQEVTEAEGTVQVHVPFSMTDMSQTENRLEYFSENSAKCRKEFTHLTQAYHLTWEDVYYILTSTLTNYECAHIWQATED